MNSRVQSLVDQGGLNNGQSQLEALEQSRLLGTRAPSAPTDFQLLVRGSIGSLLPVYGDSLFRQVPSTFAPLREVNVTPDYLLGPGDQLVVRIWGQVNFNAQLTVDRSGAIYLPQVGEVHGCGLALCPGSGSICMMPLSHIYKSFDLKCGKWASSARFRCSSWVRLAVLAPYHAEFAQYARHGTLRYGRSLGAGVVARHSTPARWANHHAL